jgi:hypothetical protein
MQISTSTSQREYVEIRRVKWWGHALEVGRYFSLISLTICIVLVARLLVRDVYFLLGVWVWKFCSWRWRRYEFGSLALDIEESPSMEVLPSISKKVWVHFSTSSLGRPPLWFERDWWRLGFLPWTSTTPVLREISGDWASCVGRPLLRFERDWSRLPTNTLRRPS